MKRTLTAAVLVVTLTPIVPASQTGSLQCEVLISTLPTADLIKQVAAATGTVEPKSEVARGGPAAAVVRTTGCMKDTAGACKVNLDVVIYKPDGSVFHEARSLDLPAGRGVVPLKIDANAETGIYKVVVTVRDLTARRFATGERQFGVR
jgi:hypothetical protein